MEVIFSKLAYCKLFLHLAKYPHSSCNGLLLAQKPSSSNRINFVDCVPLFHSSLSLTPSFELALFQIDSYCQQNDLEIAGYYQATENIQDNKPNIITFKIAEKIKENNPNSLVFMIDNHKIHPSNKKPCFQIFNYVDQNLKELNCNLRLEEMTYEKCNSLLKEKTFTDLTDFDNHLDDLSADWRNLNLENAIL